MSKLALRLEQGDTETTVTVNRDNFTLGRLPECDLCLSVVGISRYHARFCKTPSGIWTVEDMGSKNGTRLNDRAVTSPQEVRHDDVVWLGELKIVAIVTAEMSVNLTGGDALSQGTTILHNVKDLQKQWIEVDSQGDVLSNKEKVIARLKDLVEIAKGLSAAESIEAIFSQVQQVVFRYLKSIDRLALLIDVTGYGELALLNAATRDVTQSLNLADAYSWVSRTICEQVFTEQVAIQTSDAQMDERFQGQQSILVKGIKSAIAVPLWDETKVVGVLYADAHHSANKWNTEGEEDLSFFSALANLVASSVQRWLLAQKLKSEAAIRQKLERYHSPAVVQQLISLDSLSDGRLLPQESEISILFADIVGFTALSERLSPGEVAELLNSLFEEMLQEIFAVGGTLDKYIGDCIMAFFGAPEPQADHGDRAVTAAKGMLTRLAKLNASQVLREPLQLRIAVNSGRAVVGDVGSSQRVDYTALGGTINLASRMESICSPGSCVVSEDTYNILSQKQDWQEMGAYSFKGIQRPIKVYQLAI
ncbi:MAG TPA: adenylate cyclase [Cyanobacteria bacterium UBA11149]|nr:adenylate cyclase [Cyanobacteria bacterium UBA11367]HBE60766.1 adenylate cyclase [Cyanobacteria bacterium UBA11366]HBK66813.1 adenylate cyclase [Cyanobacteria bacterium UBA11166]HBR72803.1 adenylate cyclase [Cyanobacteria bacterium UBA11159]HBS72269.1 adenylate cyclase [Cyanobacteria bacterium UBA11153]HBW88303.1 adenylate cyclase [Cyanobacteria bacterium UBA11149]HCA95125.1 adenylate cyclase [Cyanobacteria bacterium UBA9226]